MTEVARILPAAAVFAFLAGFLFLVKRLVERQHAKLCAHLDQFDYVVIEAHPQQLPDLQDSFVRSGWRLVESKRYDAEGMLYRFETTERDPAPLSQLLGHSKGSVGPAVKPTVKYQMKIKAHGMKGDFHA